MRLFEWHALGATRCGPVQVGRARGGNYRTAGLGREPFRSESAGDCALVSVKRIKAFVSNITV